MADALPQLHERRRRTQKLLSGSYKRCSAFMSHEQWPPELLLKDTSPHADRRPTDMQSVSSFLTKCSVETIARGSGTLSVTFIHPRKCI